MMASRKEDRMNLGLGLIFFGVLFISCWLRRNEGGLCQDFTLMVDSAFGGFGSITMLLLGLGIAVPNARPEVKAAAHWVTRQRGGQGAVREASELVLRSQALWGGILKRYV